MVYARAPASPPSVVRQQPQRRPILFRHPGYDDDNNVLFKLYTPDEDTDDREYGGEATHRSGLYAQVALDACAVITGNRTEGWLSTSPDVAIARDNRVDAASTLHERDYYFHLDCEPGDSNDSPYSVVPTFREWRFPHDRVPSHWQQMASDSASLDSAYSPSNLATALQVRDGSCRMSGCREGLQVAHLVPQAESDWWKSNDMSRYNFGTTDTLDDPTNALLLRADLHIAFDKPRFAFVPKPAYNADGMRLVVHLLEPSIEFTHLYHNRELHTLAVGIEMLYARFAWSIFPLLGAFLSCRIGRRLTIRAPNPKLVDRRGFFAAAYCEEFSATATRRRSQSPKKRKPEVDNVVDPSDMDIHKVDEREQSNDELDSAALVSSKRKRKLGAEHSGTESELPDDWPPRKRSRGQTSLSSSLSSTQSAINIHSPLSDASDTSLQTPPRHSSMSNEWLQEERQRSDIAGRWKIEQGWMKEVWDGKVLQDDEAVRWLTGCGFELKDEEW